MNAVKRIVLLMLPLVVTPLIGILIAEGYLDFGGGDKDIVILIPWVIWSVIFIFAGIFNWHKVSQTGAWFLKSLIQSILIVVVMWLCLLVFSLVTTA